MNAERAHDSVSQELDDCHRFAMLIAHNDIVGLARIVRTAFRDRASWKDVVYLQRS